MASARRRWRGCCPTSPSADLDTLEVPAALTTMLRLITIHPRHTSVQSFHLRSLLLLRVCAVVPIYAYYITAFICGHCVTAYISTLRVWDILPFTSNLEVYAHRRRGADSETNYPLRILPRSDRATCIRLSDSSSLSLQLNSQLYLETLKENVHTNKIKCPFQ